VPPWVDKPVRIGNTRAMSLEEPPPSPRHPRTIGFVVAVALVFLLLLLMAEIAGVGVRAWLGWWQHLP
jgi:hypothetical protein